MHILIIGGSGFLGFHITKALLQHGHKLSLFCRPNSSAESLFDETVDYRFGDLNFFRDIDFEETFNNIDAVVYAAGIDERAESTGDPYTFFYKENVTCCINFIEKAKQYGVKKALILGSIFSYWDAQKPELTLSEYHPYIRSRTVQRDYALALADDDFQVNIAEIPYVFGVSPGGSVIAKRLINYIRISSPLLSTVGGTSVISVTSLAQAISGMLEHLNESCALPIGDKNLSWVELTEAISLAANEQAKPIKTIQRNVLTDLTQVGAFLQDLLGIRSGLDPHHIIDIITLEAYIDCQPIKEQLGYFGGDWQQAINDTVKATPENPLLSNMQRSMQWLVNLLPK